MKKIINISLVVIGITLFSCDKKDVTFPDISADGGIWLWDSYSVNETELKKNGISDAEIKEDKSTLDTLMMAKYANKFGIDFSFSRWRLDDGEEKWVDNGFTWLEESDKVRILKMTTDGKIEDVRGSAYGTFYKDGNRLRYDYEERDLAEVPFISHSLWMKKQ